jgi:hypothetical protein
MMDLDKKEAPPRGNLKPFGGFTGSSYGYPTFSFNPQKVEGFTVG